MVVRLAFEGGKGVSVWFSTTGARVMYRMRRMPFGWKFSPLLCQLLVQKMIAGMVPPHMIIFRYLDDSLLLGGWPLLGA